jgi:acetyl esterase
MPSSQRAVQGIPGLADEDLARWVAQVRQPGGPPNRALGARRLREAARQRAASRPRGPELAQVRNLSTGEGLPLRLYRPAHEPRPLVIYLHGGGFVLGDLDSHDSICRRLARTADVAVLAVAYRRAPEHPAPAAIEDAVSAFTWAGQYLDELGGDPASGIGLAGDSAGGAIAALAAVRLRGQPAAASSLLLAYPNADMMLSEPSIEQEGHGWGLEADDLRWFVEQWIPEPRDRANPDLSPVHATLSGLPPTVIATAGHDPLRDEGSTLAGLMHAAGADVTYLPHPGLVHGFLGLAHVSPAAARAGEDLFRRFGAVAHR